MALHEADARDVHMYTKNTFLELRALDEDEQPMLGRSEKSAPAGMERWAPGKSSELVMQNLIKMDGIIEAPASPSTSSSVDCDASTLHSDAESMTGGLGASNHVDVLYSTKNTFIHVCMTSDDEEQPIVGRQEKSAPAGTTRWSLLPEQKVSLFSAPAAVESDSDQKSFLYDTSSTPGLAQNLPRINEESDGFARPHADTALVNLAVPSDVCSETSEVNCGATSLDASFADQGSLTPAGFDEMVVCTKNTFLDVRAIFNDDDEQPMIGRQGKSAPAGMARWIPEIIRSEELVSFACGKVAPGADGADTCIGIYAAGTTASDDAESSVSSVDILSLPTSDLAIGACEVSRNDADIVFDWKVDLRRKNSTGRCGFTKKFFVEVDGKEVPFIMHIDPVAKELVEGPGDRKKKRKSNESTFRRPGTYAQVWIACQRPDDMPVGGYPFGITITAGSLTKQFAASHDFAAEPKCMGPNVDAHWLIPEESFWIVKVVFTPLMALRA